MDFPVYPGAPIYCMRELWPLPAPPQRSGGTGDPLRPILGPANWCADSQGCPIRRAFPVDPGRQTAFTWRALACTVLFSDSTGSGIRSGTGATARRPNFSPVSGVWDAPRSDDWGRSSTTPAVSQAFTLGGSGSPVRDPPPCCVNCFQPREYVSRCTKL